MLTEHQSEKLAEALEILNTGDFLIIEGSAGVGKTYLVSALANKLKELYGDKVMITAPTNKATQVIVEKLTEFNNTKPRRDRTGTIHSALKLVRKTNNKTGKFFYAPSLKTKYPPLDGIKVLIIDEASMVSKEILERIEEIQEEKNLKVIFVGDVKQINPVNEEDSPVFLQDYPTVELTEIIRQGEGNPIIDLSRNTKLIRSKEEVINSEGEGYTFSNDANKVILSLAEANGSDDLKFIAYTNKRVDQVNFAVRNTIYQNPSKIEEGETLYFNEGYNTSYKTDEEITVEMLEVKIKKFFYVDRMEGKKEVLKSINLKCYSLNPEYTMDSLGNVIATDVILVIHEDSKEDFEKLCKDLKTKAIKYHIPWKFYYEFKEQFADLRYAHALTIHKSQGSTYKNVIIDTDSIKFCRKKKEKERLLYTAITRASKLVILYGEK